ncbi:MAG: PleD family two-component system response regulator [Candidatus Hydrothermarchaeales archaeon]
MTKIMLVDDEPDIIFTTKTMLEREGYEVVTARSGKECLDNIMEVKPNLVLLDIMMLKMDGWEVGKRLKEDKKTSHIPVVMFTVRTSKESRIKSFQYSKADDQIDKPYSREELLETIEKVLKKSKDVK